MREIYISLFFVQMLDNNTLFFFVWWCIEPSRQLIFDQQRWIPSLLPTCTVSRMSFEISIVCFYIIIIVYIENTYRYYQLSPFK